MCGAAPLGKLDEDRLVQKADNGLNVMQGKIIYIFNQKQIA